MALNVFSGDFERSFRFLQKIGRFTVYKMVYPAAVMAMAMENPPSRCRDSIASLPRSPTDSQHWSGAGGQPQGSGHSWLSWEESWMKTIGKPLESGGFIGFNGDLDEYGGFHCHGGILQWMVHGKSLSL